MVICLCQQQRRSNMSQMVSAVQSGDEIIVSNEWGTVTTRIKGDLISFSNGKLTYRTSSGINTRYL